MKRAYAARVSKYIDLKESVSNNVKTFDDGWEKIVNRLKNGILTLSKKVGTKTDSGEQQPDVLDIPEKDMNLIEKVFDFNTPDKMLQILHGLKRVDSYIKSHF